MIAATLRAHLALRKTRPLVAWLRIVTVAVSLFSVSPARAEEVPPPTSPPEIGQPSPEIAVRGSRVTVPGKRLPSDNTKINLILGQKPIGHPSWVSPDGTSLIFFVPENVPLGSQLLRINTLQSGPNIASSDFPIGFVSVVADVKAQFALDGTSAAVAPLGTQRLSLIGSGMGGSLADYVLLRDNQSIGLCPAESSAPKKTSCVGIRSMFVSPYELALEGPFDPSWLGKHELGLRRGDVTADGSAKVQFIPYTSTQLKLTSTLFSVDLFLGLLFVAIYFAKPYRVGSTRYRFSTFLIDPETDTYSLSKLQFYLWSAAALIGYGYLTFSRVFAQGQFELADIPENLPGIIAISGATTAISIGVSSVHGAKAAGDERPSFSDLFSIAGTIAAERFQFLLWTLVAIGAFLLSVFSVDPLSITDLPSVPPRLLLLSGVSAAGYLVGKMLRRPGPIIDQILVAPETSALDVMGRNLEANAGFELNGTPLGTYLVADNNGVKAPKLVERAKSGVGSSSRALSANAPDFATVLRFELRGVPASLLSLNTLAAQSAGVLGSLTLTIINSDGQRAAWPFDADETARRRWTEPPSPTPADKGDAGMAPKPSAGAPSTTA